MRLTDKPFLTVKEAADVLEVSTRTIHSWIKDGVIPHVRIGPKLIRIPTAKLLTLGDDSEGE